LRYRVAFTHTHIVPKAELEDTFKIDIVRADASREASVPILIVLPTKKVESLRRVFDQHADEPPIVTVMMGFEEMSQLLYEKPKGDGSDLETAAKLADFPTARS